MDKLKMHNPNVFQICSLREMASETRRRQSIGRGLRLCVDQTGQRRRDEGLNVLTVIAQEGYKEFAEGLQTEMEQTLNIKLGIVTAGLFAGLTYALPDGGTALVSVQESQAVFQALTQASLIDNKGRAKPELRAALAQNTVPLPTDLPTPAAKLIRDMLHRLTRKVPVFLRGRGHRLCQRARYRFRPAGNVDRPAGCPPGVRRQRTRSVSATPYRDECPIRR